MEVDPALRSLVVVGAALGSLPCSAPPPEQSEWSRCRYTPVPTGCVMFVQPIETSVYALYPRFRFLSLPPPDRLRGQFVSRISQIPIKSLNTQQFLYRQACGKVALRLFATILIPLLRILLL